METNVNSKALGLVLKNVTVKRRNMSRYGLGASSTRGYKDKPRCYVFVSGETIWENLTNRRCRPANAYLEFVPEAVALAVRELGLSMDPSKVKARWSQRAGCKCGCSPGFILDGFYAGVANFDIAITLTDTSHADGGVQG